MNKKKRGEQSKLITIVIPIVCAIVLLVVYKVWLSPFIYEFFTKY